jgi:hypothetical protein
MLHEVSKEIEQNKAKIDEDNNLIEKLKQLHELSDFSGDRYKGQKLDNTIKGLINKYHLPPFKITEVAFNRTIRTNETTEKFTPTKTDIETFLCQIKNATISLLNKLVKQFHSVKFWLKVNIKWHFRKVDELIIFMCVSKKPKKKSDKLNPTTSQS